MTTWKEAWDLYQKDLLEAREKKARIVISSLCDLIDERPTASAEETFHTEAIVE